MNQKGFTYILALTLVMVMGIMLGMVGQSWQMLKKREQEEELLFRGNQVLEALYQRMLCKSANINAPPNVINQFLPPMTDVIKTLTNPSTLCVDGKMRTFLRKSATVDPITLKDWNLLSPIGDPSRFIGVASTSTQEPLKKKGFPDELSVFNDQKQYSDWQFTWELKKNSLTVSPNVNTTP